MAAERTVLVRLKAEVNDFQRGMVEAGAAVKALTKEIDTSSDRTAWLAQGILALAPAAVTLGAGAVPAIAGIATQMTVTAAAAGTMALAFHGVGGALTALNTYQVEPTAVHLVKLHEAMAKIGPDGAQFVHFLDSIGGQMNALSDTARAGMFPGLEDGIKHLLTLLPRVQDIVGKIGSGIGELAGEAGKGLAGSKFEAFFAWLDHDARPILLDMGRTVGNLAEGIANMLVGFGPESRGFSHGLLEMSRAFAQWSRTLDNNQSFQGFLDYVHTAGPKALDFLGALIQTGTALLKAWAPVGQVMLPALTDLLDIITKIADTPIGPLVLGIAALASAYGRLRAIGSITSAGIFTRLNSGLVEQTRLARVAIPTMTQFGNAMMHSMHSQDQLNKSFGTSIKYGQQNAQVAIQSRNAVTSWTKSLAPAGLAIAAIGLISTGTADKIGMSNTASLALAGTLAGPLGSAAGAAVGSFLDVRSAVTKANQSIDGLKRASNSFDLRGLQKQIDAVQESASHNSLGTFLNTSWHGWTGGNNIQDQQREAANTAFEKLQGNATALQSLFTQFNDGKPDQFGQTWATTNKQLEQTATQAAPAMRHLGISVKELRAAADANDGSLATLAKQIVDWTRKSDAASKRQKALKAATLASKEAASTTATAFITLGASLDDSKVSLKDWIRQLNQDAQALEDFGSNAAKAANKGLRDGLIKQLEAAGPTGALRMKQLANASESEIKKANGAYLHGQRAIENYTAAVTGIPNPKLNVDPGPAIRGINIVANALRNLPSSKTITINERHTGGHTLYDTGGYTGDGPKMEVRGLVHAGEIVLPQDVVNRDWGKLKAAYGYLPGFAEGGYVSGRSMQPASRGQKFTVDLGNLSVTGTLNTPWGPAQVRGIARAEATDVYHHQKAADDRHEGALNG